MTSSGDETVESADGEERGYDDHPAHVSLERADLDTETRLMLLLRDHESAGNDARYRDRLVHTGFYLSLIFAGVLVDTGIRLWLDGHYALLTLVALFGASSYYVLYVWTESFLGARNAAWSRRRQIENEVARWYPGLLKGHSDVFDRLSYDGQRERFEHAGRSSVGKLSSSSLTIGYIKTLIAAATLVAVVSAVFRYFQTVVTLLP
jgi:hypothetical protein